MGGLVARAQAPAARPKATILIVLEQFRSDYLGSVTGHLGPGGFRRLLEDGACFPDCRHAASSFTASGLATLATGAWPAQHGIVADSWYDRRAQRTVAASAETLQATTLAAQVAAEPHGRVFVVAQDRSHADLFAGTQAARSFWMDERGQFATPGDPPQWLSAYNRFKPLENLHDAKWLAVGARPDAPPLRTLAYDPANIDEFLRLYRASPFAQAAEFELLGELVGREKVGQGSTLDFVCLVSGAAALLGYDTGGRSPLMREMALQLDRNIAYLFETLDRNVGEDGYNLVFTAAHGAPPEPAPENRSGLAVSGEALAQAIQKALAARGLGRVQKYVYPFLYLDVEGMYEPELARVAAGGAALASPAVANYYTAGGACSTRVEEWARRFRNSFHATRSGDLMLSYQAEHVEDFGLARGVSYGSLYNYDVQVPLFFYGPQFQAGTFEGPVESVDVAGTLARAMGVAAPSSSSGRTLGVAFGRSGRTKK